MSAVHAPHVALAAFHADRPAAGTTDVDATVEVTAAEPRVAHDAGAGRARVDEMTPDVQSTRTTRAVRRREG